MLYGRVLDEECRERKGKLYRVKHLLQHSPGFSVDGLLNILNRLGHSVEVRISAKEYDPEEAQTLVTVG
jgi:hypothetical protein